MFEEHAVDNAYSKKNIPYPTWGRDERLELSRSDFLFTLAYRLPSTGPGARDTSKIDAVIKNTFSNYLKALTPSSVL